MSRTLTGFDMITSLLQQVGTRNAPWRFVLSLGIMIVGFLLLEFLYRAARQRIRAMISRKGISADAWNLSSISPYLRLSYIALLLILAESILTLPTRVSELLHAVEALLFSLSATLICFKAIDLIDRLHDRLPGPLKEGFPAPAVAKLKGILRVSVLIVVAAIFVYAQRNLFPELLWKYAWWRYLLVVVIVNAVVLLVRLSEKFLSGMLMELKDSEEKIRTRLVLQATIWPIRLFLIAGALYAVKEILPLPGSLNRIAGGASGLLTTMAVVVFLYRLVDLITHELGKVAQRPDNLIDQSFVQMIRIFSRLIVIVVGAIYIFTALTGKPMSALLAGLGIGGLAVALAAQDTLKNFFGSIMIMLDKPFDVGQRVLVEGFDGVVEDIGFRSTRLRTQTGHEVTVPNEKMAGSNIENIDRRPSIRRLTNITVAYDTPADKVELAINIIRGILQDHEGMHPELPPRVYFNEFNDTSLNLQMIYWYHPPSYWDFIAFSQKVNLEIMRAFKKEGIEFAFPTTTNFLAHDERRPLHIHLSDYPGAVSGRTGPAISSPESGRGEGVMAEDT